MIETGWNFLLFLNNIFYILKLSAIGIFIILSNNGTFILYISISAIIFQSPPIVMPLQTFKSILLLKVIFKEVQCLNVLISY